MTEAEPMPERSGRRHRSARPQREVVMVLSFEGWNDAGEAASAAVEHLRDSWGAEEIEAIDSEDYYDFQFTRPTISRDERAVRHVEWPASRIYRASVPGSRVDVLLVRGVEPSFRWRTFTRRILDIARRENVGTVICVGALLADVPHSRPIPVTCTADDPEVGDRLALEVSNYEGPVGILGVVADAADREGLPTLSLWAAVPHYVSQAPSPKAELALLDRLEELLDVPVPLDEVREDAEAWERGVNELAEEDPEIAEYVHHLEETKDTIDLPESSGEAIAREFERYLRRRGEGRR